MLKKVFKKKKSERERENDRIRIQHPLLGITFAEFDADKQRERTAERAYLK